MKKLWSILLITFFVASCSQSRYTFNDEIYEEVKNLTVVEAVSFENHLNSKDVTPKHLIEIGEGIYPNEQGFELATPKTFQRVQKPHFELEIDYYYSLPDSIVRVILYQWDYLKDRELYFQQLSDKEKQQKISAFDDHFQYLQEYLTEKLGNPTFSEINSIKEEDSFRDGYKWLNKENINAYLFMLGNNQNTYRQIRLAIYSE